MQIIDHLILEEQMNKRFMVVLLVAMALIVSVSAHAFQAAERNAPPAATKA